MNRRSFLAVLGGSFLFPGLPGPSECASGSSLLANPSFEDWGGPHDDWVPAKSIYTLKPMNCPIKAILTEKLPSHLEWIEDELVPYEV